MIKETFDYIVRLANISVLYYVAVVVIGIIAWLKWKRLPVALLVSYMLIVFSIAVLSRCTGNHPNNFILFKTYRNGIDKQILTNIVLFIPIGLLLGSINWKLGWIGPAFSVLIEISQLLLQRGMFDVDDIVSNTVGTIVGVAVALLVGELHQNVLMKGKNHQ